MNSGDWVENLTALEYDNGEWNLYRYDRDVILKENPKITRMMQPHTLNSKLKIG